VVSLSAVNPNHLGVVHWDRKSGELSGAITDRFVSRIKTTSHRFARVAKGGLSSGVVFLVELEGDGISRLGSNSARLEREGTGSANDNTMIGASARGRRRARDRGRGGSGLRRRGYGARRVAAGHCGCFVGGELVPRVHCEDHPLLTMICLPAVHPNRIATLDEELSRGEGPCRIVSGDWNKSGIKASSAALARAVKGGLGDGVVFLLEVEDYDISRLGIHKLWGKFDTSAAHGHVELGSSHLDCDGGKESGKP